MKAEEKKMLYIKMNSKWKDYRIDSEFLSEDVGELDNEFLESTTGLKEVTPIPKFYPSEDEAEAAAEWYNAIVNVSITIGSGGRELISAFREAEAIRMKIHKKIFGDKSPWSLNRKGKKVTVVWDNGKAKTLGL